MLDARCDFFDARLRGGRVCPWPRGTGRRPRRWRLPRWRSLAVDEPGQSSFQPSFCQSAFRQPALGEPSLQSAVPPFDVAQPSVATLDPQPPFASFDAAQPAVGPFDLAHSSFAEPSRLQRATRERHRQSARFQPPVAGAVAGLFEPAGTAEHAAGPSRR